ncbi:MAG TPA: hypothetical protein VMV86_00915 [Methanosarcinales archaeon]|nr:hypothetical protein [Methanosarcinales archaeon]
MGEVTTKTKFQALYIDPECRKKLQYWADAATGEVSGLGLVENEDGKMVVREVFILEQECTGSETELDTEAIAKLMTELLQNDKDPSKLKFWWHSHVNMGVFWSGTDDECAETLSSEFAFSTVVNKKGESKTRLDLYEPFRITVDNIRLLEITAEDENLKKQCEQDVKDKVKEKTWRRSWNNDKSGGYFDNKDKSHGRREHWENWGGYHDPYSYGSSYSSEKIKLKEPVIEDIKTLADFVFDHGFKPIAIEAFKYDLIQQAIRNQYEDKAECKDGIGTYEESEKLCESCKIAKQCQLVAEKFEEFEYEDDYNFKGDEEAITEGSVEVIVDPDN